MFGWLARRRHELELRMTSHFTIKLSTSSASLIRDVIGLAGRVSVRTVNNPPQTDGTEIRYTDPNYEAWDKQTAAEDAAEAAAEAAWEAAESAKIAQEAANELRKESHKTEASKTVHVDAKTETEVERSLVTDVGGAMLEDTAKTAQEAAREPREGFMLADRVGSEKLVALAESMRQASMQQAAPASEVPAKPFEFAGDPSRWKTSKVEENGAITFRVKCMCPSCGKTHYRYKTATSSYVKCRYCETKLLLEAPSNDTVYDGRVGHDVPAPDLEGNHFHAYRLYDL